MSDERGQRALLLAEIKKLRATMEPCDKCEGHGTVWCGHLGETECSNCEGSGVEPDPRLGELQHERDTLRQQVQESNRLIRSYWEDLLFVTEEESHGKVIWDTKMRIKAYKEKWWKPKKAQDGQP